jgi:endonuclease G
MRVGYQNDFLANFIIELPEPSLSLAGDVLAPTGLPEGETVIPYIHYSIIMSKSTKQALYSAANVDNNNQQTVSGSKGRKWFIDERVGRDNQITNDAYTGTPWDRGHLTRRTAVTWGDCSTALAASNDSCSYTNASMQHKRFNEDEWRVPETAVAKFSLAKDNKLIVMTGPVFSICDRFFTKRYGFEAVRIPSGFWKTLTYVDMNDNLVTAAYIFFQDTDTLRTTKAKKRIRLRNFRVTTTELQLWTGLQFSKQMFDSNPLQFYSGPEAIKVNKLKDLSNSTEALLAAGVIEGDAYDEAKISLDLDTLYELVEELSWY